MVEKREALKLPKATEHLIQECRMVLPGIQALLGFQFIAVFHESFENKLSHLQQLLHVTALGLVAVAVCLVMTPAAYHRQIEPHTVSDSFITFSSLLLLWSMLPLMVGIILDIYLVASIILRQVAVPVVLSFIFFCAFISLWYLFPRMRKR